MTDLPYHEPVSGSKKLGRFSNSAVWRFLMEDVRDDLLLETQLLLLTFATGIQDATTFPDYLCFASNQTGNTVFLAIGAAGLVGREAFSYQNIGVSLALFVGGGWAMGQMGNYFGVRNRLWLITSSFLQTAMVIAAVLIQYILPIRREGATSFAVVSLLAFSSGGQVAMARSLKIHEITTAMATAAYVDLFSDPWLLKPHNRSRNRRFGFLAMLSAGSFAGAYAHGRVNSAFALLLCAIGKTLVTIALLWNKSVKSEPIEK